MNTTAQQAILGNLSRQLHGGFPIAIRRADGTGYLDSAEIPAFRVKGGKTYAVTAGGEFQTVRSMAWLTPRLAGLGGWVPIGRNYTVNLHQLHRIENVKGISGFVLTFADGIRLTLLPGYDKPVLKFFGVRELDRIFPISTPFNHLLDMGVREVPTDIRFTSEDDLRKIFSTVSGDAIIVSVLIASFLWQQACYIRQGKPSIVAGKNVRSLWYKIKPTLDRLHVSDDTDHYKTLSEQMAEMVAWKIFTYREFGLREHGSWSVGPYNPHVVIVDEKKADEDYLKEAQDLTGATYIATGGEPATISMEYFAQALREKLDALPGKPPLIILALVDYDPFGWTLRDTFIGDLVNFGLPHPVAVINLAVPKNYDPEQIPYLKTDLTKSKEKVPAGMLRKWMKLTDGIDGKPYGLSVDDLWEDTAHVQNLILEAGKPYFLVPPPVPTRFWKETHQRRQRLLQQAQQTIEKLHGPIKPRHKR